MTTEERTHTSKFLSYVLRHRPDAIGIELDRAGWVDVDTLLVKAAENDEAISPEQLDEVVATNDKQRFEFSEDRSMIRARQGHSVNVDLGYEPTAPPEILYHGTPERNLASIREQGLLKGRRHHVHLSENIETTMKVAMRYGKPRLLTIQSGQMHADGHVFYRTGNGVWLTEHVPAKYIDLGQVSGN